MEMAEMERQQLHIFARTLARWKEHTAESRRGKELQATLDTFFVYKTLTTWQKTTKVRSLAE